MSVISQVITSGRQIAPLRMTIDTLKSLRLRDLWRGLKNLRPLENDLFTPSQGALADKLVLVGSQPTWWQRGWITLRVALNKLLLRFSKDRVGVYQREGRLHTPSTSLLDLISPCRRVDQLYQTQHLAKTASIQNRLGRMIFEYLTDFKLEESSGFQWHSFRDRKQYITELLLLMARDIAKVRIFRPPPSDAKPNVIGWTIVAGIKNDFVALIEATQAALKKEGLFTQREAEQIKAAISTVDVNTLKKRGLGDDYKAVLNTYVDQVPPMLEAVPLFRAVQEAGAEVLEQLVKEVPEGLDALTLALHQTPAVKGDAAVRQLLETHLGKDRLAQLKRDWIDQLLSESGPNFDRLGKTVKIV
jgi:hypothetical protein